MQKQRISILSKDQLEAKLRIDYPSEGQLELINRYRPRGRPEYSASDLISVPMLASSNLLHEGMVTFHWDEGVLDSINASAPGKDFLLNHNWNEARDSIGFIYDSELWISDRPTAEALETSLNPNLDLEICRKMGGYYRVIMYGAIEADHPAINDIYYRRFSDISIGGSPGYDFYCPECNIPFTSHDCPHYLPHVLLKLFLDEEDLENMADYAIARGKFVVAESSICVKGLNLQAKIIDHEFQLI